MFAAQAQLIRVVAALRSCVVFGGGQSGVAASLCAGWQAGDWVGLAAVALLGGLRGGLLSPGWCCVGAVKCSVACHVERAFSVPVWQWLLSLLMTHVADGFEAGSIAACRLDDGAVH